MTSSVFATVAIGRWIGYRIPTAAGLSASAPSRLEDGQRKPSPFAHHQAKPSSTIPKVISRGAGRALGISVRAVALLTTTC
jgi:hypothetical protein